MDSCTTNDSFTKSIFVWHCLHVTAVQFKSCIFTKNFCYNIRMIVLSTMHTISNSRPNASYCHIMQTVENIRC